MTSTLTQTSGIPPHQLSSTISATSVQEPKATDTHDVIADFHYYKDPGDGSPPAPAIVGKPETYERDPHTISKKVHDIRGTEDQYSLDTTGFQIYKHESVEKDFLDDEQIQRVYYPEIENLLKAALVASTKPSIPALIYKRLTNAQHRRSQDLHLRPHSPSPTERRP